MLKFPSIESEYEWPLPNHAGEVVFETEERGLDVGRKKALEGTSSPDDEGAVVISGEACGAQAFKVVLDGTCDTSTCSGEETTNSGVKDDESDSWSFLEDSGSREGARP